MSGVGTRCWAAGSLAASRSSRPESRKPSWIWITVERETATSTPIGLAGCDVNDAPGDRFQWFNTGCFVQPAFGTWGNSGQGIVNDPGINIWNSTFAKIVSDSGGS